LEEEDRSHPSKEYIIGSSKMKNEEVYKEIKKYKGPRKKGHGSSKLCQRSFTKEEHDGWT